MCVARTKTVCSLRKEIGLWEVYTSRGQSVEKTKQYHLLLELRMEIWQRVTEFVSQEKNLFFVCCCLSGHKNDPMSHEKSWVQEIHCKNKETKNKILINKS